MSQLAASIRLLQNGAVLLTTAFSFGIFIPATKFPRIALATHVNLILHGLLSIAAGLVLRSGAVELEEWQVWLVAGAHFYSWVVNSVTACNAFWGASKTMPILAKESGATGAKTWQEVLVKGAAFGTIILIPAWGVLAFSL